MAAGSAQVHGRLGVLISGRGSNMLAIAEACASGRIPGRIALVISDQPDAPGLAAAADHGITTLALPYGESRSRKDHDMRMAAALKEHGVDLVCLAGYMRLLSPAFVREFPGRIMNIHPALLPSFAGLHAQKQAVEHGVRVSGVTVHYVDDGLDSGPIILQCAVPVYQDDTEESLGARIIKEEHRIYPEAIGLHLTNRLRIEGRKVRITG